jgi:hypothetical protein
MKGLLAKIFLAALPLTGVMMTAPMADAHWRHHFHHHPHCRPYAERGWYDNRGHYSDGDHYRRGWYEDRQHRYDGDDNYPSRYPHRRYEDRRYYGGDYPWWSVVVDR